MVLAVNAWNEPRATVAGFVEKNRLPYKVLLTGSRVATELYRADALPTNVLIDREGRILYQHAGFSPAGAPAMEGRIREALAKR